MKIIIPQQADANVVGPSLRQLRALILGAQLAQLRQDNRMSRAELALLMGLGTADVARIERGSARNVDEVRRYAGVLGASVTATRDGTGYAVTIS